MRLLLTGGSGFWGSHIAERLSAERVPVRVLVRASSDVSFLKSLPGLELAQGSMEQPETLARALGGVTHVLHAAGVLKANTPAEFLRVNAIGTENLVRAAAAERSVVRFVLVSSLTVSGPCRSGLPVNDDVEPAPLTHYARSKLAAERAALSEKQRIPLTILRPGAVYGPRDKEILVFFKSVQRGVLPLVAPPHHRVTMVHATDCAAACVRALHANVPSGSIYHVDDGAEHTFAEMLREVETALGKRAWLSFRLPRPLVLGAAFTSEVWGRISGRAVIFTRDKCKELFEEWVCDAERGRRDLDYRPQVSFSQGVRLTAEWYRQAGWLS